MSLEAGDLVRAKDDPQNLCGMGIVYDKLGRHQVKVHWFEERMIGPNNRRQWLQVYHLENINERQKDT